MSNHFHEHFLVNTSYLRLSIFLGLLLGITVTNSSLAVSASSSDPNFVKQNVINGDKFYAEGDYVDAEPIYMMAAKQGPTNPRYQDDAGRAMFAQGRFTDADRFYARAIKLDPTNARYQDDAGENLIDQRNYRYAMNFLRKATILDPKNARYLNDVGVDFDAEGKYSEAEYFMQKAVLLECSCSVLVDTFLSDSATVVRSRCSQCESFIRMSTSVRQWSAL